MQYRGGCALALVGAFAVAVSGCGANPDFYEDIAQANDVQRPRPARGSLVGAWSGVGQQSDGASWQMELDIANTQEGACAIVRYPDVGCAGYWTCLCDDEGGHLQAVERITEGRDRCIDGVSVDVGLSRDGSLVFNGQTSEIDAKARLERATP